MRVKNKDVTVLGEGYINNNQYFEKEIIMPEVAEEAKTTVVETADVEQQIEKLRDMIGRLQKEIDQRQANFEINLRQLKRDRDEKIVALRADYDGALNQGDAAGADKVLDEISKVRKDLVNVAKNVADSDSDIADLKKRVNILHLESNNLNELALAYRARVKDLMDQVNELTGTVTYSIKIHSMFELERTIGETKKIAEQILSE